MTQPKVKMMVIIRGKGTKNETRIQTNIPMYWSNSLQQYVTIPTTK